MQKRFLVVGFNTTFEFLRGNGAHRRSVDFRDPPYLTVPYRTIPLSSTETLYLSRRFDVIPALFVGGNTVCRHGLSTGRRMTSLVGEVPYKATQPPLLSHSLVLVRALPLSLIFLPFNGLPPPSCEIFCQVWCHFVSISLQFSRPIAPNNCKLSVATKYIYFLLFFVR